MCRVKRPAGSGYASRPKDQRPVVPTSPTPPSHPPPPPQPTWPYNDPRLAFYDPDLIEEADKTMARANKLEASVQIARTYAEKQVTRNRNRRTGRPEPAKRRPLGLRFEGVAMSDGDVETWTAALAAEAEKKGWRGQGVERVDSGIVVSDEETSKAFSSTGVEMVQTRAAARKRKLNPSKVAVENYEREKRVRFEDADDDDDGETTEPSSSRANPPPPPVKLPRLNLKAGKRVQTTPSPRYPVYGHLTQASGCYCEDQKGLRLLHLSASIDGTKNAKLPPIRPPYVPQHDIPLLDALMDVSGMALREMEAAETMVALSRGRVFKGKERVVG